MDEARAHPDRRLEVMCGTVRISFPIVRAGMELTCVDYSSLQLDALRQKLAREGLCAAAMVEADVRDLPWRSAFDYVFIGFHSFAELVAPEDPLTASISIRLALVALGRAVISLQNPAVKGPQLTGAWSDVGTFPAPHSDRSLQVRGRYLFDSKTGIATGSQIYREIDRAGRCARDLELPVRFRLHTDVEFTSLATRAGLRIERRWGGYDRSPFNVQMSPYLIAELAVWSRPCGPSE